MSALGHCLANVMNRSKNFPSKFINCCRRECHLYGIAVDRETVTLGQRWYLSAEFDGYGIHSSVQLREGFRPHANDHDFTIRWCLSTSSYFKCRIYDDGDDPCHRGGVWRNASWFACWVMVHSGLLLVWTQVECEHYCEKLGKLEMHTSSIDGTNN